MTRDRHRGGRTTPKGTRPLHAVPSRSSGQRREPDPLDSLIDQGGEDLLANGDPVGAETWASTMLHLFESTRRDARIAGQDVPPFETAMLDRCRNRRDTAALLVATAMAAVAPAPLQRRFADVARSLARTVTGPEWLDRVGRHRPTRAFLAGDVFGDQDSIMIGFDDPESSAHHALAVLVDHNLSGQAKDAWLADDLDDVASNWRDLGDPHLQVREIAVDDALARLRAAMATSDLWNGDTDLRSDDFARHRALVWARLHSADLTSTDTEQQTVPQTDRDALVAEFMASNLAAEVSERHPDADVEIVAHYLVDLRCDYEGRPLRWSPMVVESILVDLAPRKLLLQPADAEAFCGTTRAFVRFAAGRTGLADEWVDEILEAIDHSEPIFRQRKDDPAASGPAKAILAALGERGVDLSDAAAIEAALDDLDPDDIDLGPILGMPAGRTRPPRPTKVEARASAEGALVLARFEQLAGFYGEGRKLTKTGNPTLADARALVDLLGTNDQVDPQVGDRTYKTTSAADLVELSFTIRWAKASGAVRAEHGKLRATKRWGSLDVLERWERAADSLPEMGPLATWFQGTRFGDADQLVDHLTAEILDVLLDGPVPFDALLEGVCRRGDQVEWQVRYMQDPDMRRMSLRSDLDRLVAILGWAGIADRTDTTVAPDRYTRSGQRVVGGVVDLTSVGRWWFDRD